MNFNFETAKFENLNSEKDKLAILGSDGSLSWSELYFRTQELKGCLAENGARHNCPVIIYGHKEYTFPIAILACISLNLPYISVDRIYPEERINKIRDLANAQVLINCGEYDLDVKLPLIIDKTFKVYKTAEIQYANPLYNNPDDPLRYILFTSGSTGEPKGVQISKESLNSFVNWVKNDYGFSEKDVFMNQSPFSFDVSLYDMAGALSLGGSVILTGQELASDPEKFFGILKETNCSIWTSTPSFAYMYIREQDFSNDFLPELKTFIFAGEDLSPRLAGMLSEKFPNARIMNAYGPTEATVTTTLIEITEDHFKDNDLLPIGYKKPGSELLIENESRDREKEGEIIIVGDHVSVGYLNNEELNSKKFTIVKGKRAFYTGDLGYFRGKILYLVGRNDDLIKMHGYRIELSEISNELMNDADIDMAVSIPLKRGSEIKRIVSYLSIANKDVDRKSLVIRLKESLNTNLPSYMIPGDMIFIDEFPVNKNHKIDKQKLAEMYPVLKKENKAF